jgi:hypothetical protein
MDTIELNVEERFALVRLMMELRQAPPIGVVGLIETRNLLARLFPDFAVIRDQDIDTIFELHARDLAESQSEDDEDSDS